MAKIPDKAGKKDLFGKDLAFSIKKLKKILITVPPRKF